MGAKKKKGGGKKKKSNVVSAASVGIEALSVSTPTILNDVSSLLFESKNNSTLLLPYIGAVAIVEGEGKAVHGRGIIATKDIIPGECLFVIPAIAAADVTEVCRCYSQDGDGDGDGDGETNNDGDAATPLEKLTEDNLIEQIESLCEVLNDEEIQPQENVLRARRLLNAFTAQMKDDNVPEMENSSELMNTLLATESSSSIAKEGEADLARDAILSIIRRNAFGPDWKSYHNFSQYLATDANFSPNRLLGSYPLSAMINHSCCPNAVRVFGRIPASNSKSSSFEIDNIQGSEVMIVHANAHIKQGEEILWSYVAPSTPFAIRREMLESNFGFVCKCTRCIKEEESLSLEGKELWEIADNSFRQNNNSGGESNMLISLVPSIENTLSSTKQISNECQRYLRVGYSTLYMQFFNATLSVDNKESLSQALKIATQLHFSFVSCNNVSTEHLSILHLCYDLATMQRTRAMQANDSDETAQTTSQVVFWTEQLKRAHMIRYGELGMNIETIRKAMKHTKLVLRTREGWHSANGFI